MNIFSQRNFKNISLLIFCAVFFLTYFAANQSTYASDCDDETKCGVGRIRSCNAAGEPSGLVFDPTMNGADIMLDLSIPSCTAIATGSYLLVKAAIARMCSACGLNQYPDITPSPVRDSYLLVLGGIKVASNPNNSSCSGAYADAWASFGGIMAAFGITYAVAKNVFDNTILCGADWLTPDPNKYSISKPGIKAEMEAWVGNNPSAGLGITNYNQWYYAGVEVEDNPSSGEACLDPTGSNTKPYPKQKYYLRGTQAGNYNCSKYDTNLSTNNIPTDRIADYKKAFDCCKNRSQNYACIKYTTDASVGPLSNNNGVFCKSGDNNCIVKGVTFSVAPIETNDSRMLCVQSYSLCPYNFTIGKGGTKYCDYYQDGILKDGKYTYISSDDIARATAANNPTNDCNSKSEIRNADCTYNAKAGQCKNYCQYLTHCTVVGSSNYQYTSSLGSPYFSSACYNFVGDSRNLSSFNSGIIMGSQRHFSTPIAQCVKETLENVFYNKAGHSQCANADEYPLADGTCASGNYIRSGSFVYKKGNPVKTVSFFSGLQNALQGTVRVVLTLAIMFYGLKILIAHNMSEIKKSDIIMFCIKIGLVMYFATGDAWQSVFFDGVYNSSMVFSKIVFHIESTMPDVKKDGCQFDSGSLGPAKAYPSGKDYLSIWDTLDCKIARYLGFAPTASVANIASLIFAGLFTGPVGIYFVMGLMFFGFFFIAMTIRALHIFLSSAMSIIIMVYISPIIIPTVMFPKTAGIFKNWLTNLISFCLQPMILFAYIAIFITVFDSTMIGSATFTGSPPDKAISCKSVCKDSSGGLVTGDTTCTLPGHAWVGAICKDANGNKVIDDDPTCTLAGHSLDTSQATCRDSSGNNVGGDPDCSGTGHTMVNPLTDSIACLISVDDYSKINFLETIGISIPALYTLFTDHVKEKILTIIKAAFVMYVLCEFMDQIPSIAEQLIGGASLPGSDVSAKGMMGAVTSVAEGARQRITRGGMKFGTDSFNMAKGANDKAFGGDDGEKKSSDSPKSDDSAQTGSSAEGGGESGGEKKE